MAGEAARPQADGQAGMSRDPTGTRPLGRQACPPAEQAFLLSNPAPLSTAGLPAGLLTGHIALQRCLIVAAQP